MRLTVINYVSSVQHKPQDRLDVILGLRPPQRDLPFAELDALYMHIFTSVGDIDPVREILGFVFFFQYRHPIDWTWLEAEEFLSLRPGDIELYLGNLSSLVSVEVGRGIKILHASLTDFLMDPTRSKIFWINPRARHTVLARRCLFFLQTTRHPKLAWDSYLITIYHCENAEMTLELCDDISDFSKTCSTFRRLWSLKDHKT